MESDAHFSEDGRFRYWLLRCWDRALPLMAVIGTNPSQAGKEKNDPTIRKVIGFGERLGYGGFLMLNVGAFVATDPRKWKDATDPFGSENTVENLRQYIALFRAAEIIAAWGKPCMCSQRGQLRSEAIKRAIPGMKCWGKNGDGSPRHPLMLPYSTPRCSACKGNGQVGGKCCPKCKGCGMKWDSLVTRTRPVATNG